MSKEYMPLRVYVFDQGEKNWVVARSKTDALYRYHKNVSDDIRPKDISTQRLSEKARKDIDAEYLHNYLKREKTVVVRGANESSELCAIKVSFQEMLKEVKNDDTFEPFIICSTLC